MQHLGMLMGFLFFHSKISDDDPARSSLDKYYIPFAEIKHFNLLIDSKEVFDQPMKNKQKAYEKLAEMSRNND